MFVLLVHPGDVKGFLKVVRELTVNIVEVIYEYGGVSSMS